MNFFKQPQGFYNIWYTSISGNFAFYLFYSVFAIFFVQIMEVSETETSIIFGSFMALNWGLTPIGGLISDTILGPRRSLTFGGFFMTLGYSTLAYATYYNLSNILYIGFGTILLGNSMARVNYAKALSLLYNKDPSTTDSGNTLFYASVNIGSMVSFILGALLKGDEKTNVIYAQIFAISALASLIAFIIILSSKSRWSYAFKELEKKLSYLKLSGLTIAYFIIILLLMYLLKNIDILNIIFYIIAIAVFILYFYNMKNEDKISQRKMILAFILMIEAVAFYILYSQMGTSMNFFALNNVIPVHIFGLKLNPIIYQGLNPFWIIVATPILAVYFNKQSEKEYKFNAPMQFGGAMFLSFIAFFLLGVVQFFANDAGLFSAWWLVLVNLFQSIAELMIGAIGLSMIIRLTPRRINGLVFGLWYLTLAIANIIGGKIASLTGMDKSDITSDVSIHYYGDFFLYLSGAILITALIMVTIAPLLKKLYHKS